MAGEGLGATYVRIEMQGDRSRVELDALADTGASFTKIPRNQAEKIGLKPEFETIVQLSTGVTIPRSMGYATVKVEGTSRRVPVAIGENNEPAILGFIALEILGLKVNPTTRKLEKSIPIEY